MIVLTFGASTAFADHPSSGGGEDPASVRLAEWREGPPSIVRENWRFQLMKVEARFASAHGPTSNRHGISGAVVSVRGWMAPPEPGTIVGRWGWIELDALIDDSGRDLLAIGRRARVADHGVMFVRKGPGPRTGLDVVAETVGCPEIPAGVRTLRGRAIVIVPDGDHRAETPCVLGDEMVQIAPGFAVRVTKVASTSPRVSVEFDYVIRNAPDGYDRDAPPYLFAVEGVDDAGMVHVAPNLGTPSGARTTLLHTGKHGTHRVTFRTGDAELRTLRFQLITARRSIEIPFHFSDIPLTKPGHSPAADATAVVTAPTAEMRRYRTGELAARHFVERGDQVRLELMKLSCARSVGFKGGPLVNARITGEMDLRLPIGRWWVGQPEVDAIRDHDGTEIEFANRNRFGGYRSVTRGFVNVESRHGKRHRLQFSVFHEHPPMAGLALLEGDVPVRRVTRTEVPEIEWNPCTAVEVFPGLKITLDAPTIEHECSVVGYQIERAVTGNDDPPQVPYVLRYTALDAEGAELFTDWRPAEVEELPGRRVHRGTVSVKEASGTPATLQLLVATEIDQEPVSFRFEDLPLRVDIEAR